MNFEQIIKLPVTREEFLEIPLTNQKIIHVVELGYIFVEMTDGRTIPPLPWRPNAPPFQSPPRPRLRFIAVNPHVPKTVSIDQKLSIVTHSFPFIETDYKINTGLTTFYDKKRRILFTGVFKTLNDGTEDMLFTFVWGKKQEIFQQKLIASCKAKMGPHSLELSPLP